MSANNTSRCFTQHAPLNGPPLIQDGQLKFQAHDVGWIISGFFTIIACGVSFWLISKHLMWYNKKREQRQIFRILLLVPIYAVISLASYVFWNHAIPITLVRDSYESFVLYSFFYLLLQYVSPTVEGQKEVFRHVKLDKWAFPMGFVKYRPRDGLYFLQLMKWGVLQYSVIRPLTTLAAVFLDFIGLYCESSWSPKWGYVYITIIVSVSVSIAMYCLIQFYMAIAEQLAPHRPLLKLISIKAVVFLTFWQATFLSVLTLFNVVKDTPFMTADDINTGIATLIETFEMVIFGFLHVRAFTYKVYRPPNHTPKDQTSRWKSLGHALDIRDLWREIQEGSVYMGRTLRGVEAEKEARMRIHFSQVMGRERHLTEAKPVVKQHDRNGTGREDDEEVDRQLLYEQRIRYERTMMWISESGDRFGGDFEDEVVKELRRRDLQPDWDPEIDPGVGHSRGKRSWWRGIYDRISQSGYEKDPEEYPQRERSTKRNVEKQRSDQGAHGVYPPYDLDSPPPPPSVTFEYPATPHGYSIVKPSPPRHHKAKRFKVVSGPPKNQDSPHNSRNHDSPRNSRNHFNPPALVVQESSDQTPAPRDHRSLEERIVVPQPVPQSDRRDAEILVSRSRKPASSPIPQTNNLLAVPPQFNRSDSLLGRVFADSSSMDTQSVTTPSHDTHTTELMFPRSMAAGSLQNQSQPGQLSPTQSNRSAPSKARVSPPETSARTPSGRPRPKVVLPAPLSPARYPHQADSVAQSPGYRVDDRMSSTYSDQYPSPPNETYRPRHSKLGGQPSPNLPAIKEATVPTPRIVPEIRDSDFSLSSFPSSSFQDRYPVLTTPSASSPRRLRHTGGEIHRVQDGRS
ncbi:hypothetical protein M422DRAFT_776620 [Sphaerobolus stellatus SS14]|nr:hypothetical protein M422DRAFT_776620 [Sphaerobolus stellatus SS14]